MEKTTIYELRSYNIDIKDGTFINQLFSNVEKAMKELEAYNLPKSYKDIVLDYEGVLDNYKGELLHYEKCWKRPAIYHTSQYGNYRMVTYIKERTLH